MAKSSKICQATFGSKVTYPLTLSASISPVRIPKAFKTLRLHSVQNLENEMCNMDQ